ncbi:fumarylacetoacetate hydrolase family protein [Blastococcus brunescens]|uniref:Fumarylacetoacetate hydrolase family protein n=1 Tax=Blastococcus brunescens TaxID=1564165 RepID=A0ABZ1AYF3_9ACTN|nr:fumarylacetoacetate hydrolase family protein [Blastococcus sp. BMG 8361]WRL63598.1 fumarylacetoacetate hydrolase family protein [Blastococcus sp. BMG 8361]
MVPRQGRRRACPCGPCIVTADEIGDPQNLTLTTRVNGEVRQSASTALMINGFSRLIADLSSVVTLEPGDIVAGGTPAGWVWPTAGTCARATRSSCRSPRSASSARRSWLGDDVTDRSACASPGATCGRRRPTDDLILPSEEARHDQ